MKKYLLIGLLYFSILGVKAHEQTLDIMSWNIRRKGNDKAENQWEKRKDLVIEEITKQKPAIIGFQEVVVGTQLEDLKKGLSAYQATGTEGRNTFTTGRYQKWVTSLEKAKNESNPIFYDPEQVEHLLTNIHAMNPVGIFSHASLPRMFVVSAFEDKKTGNTLYVYNTHLSSGSNWKFFKDGTSLIRTRQMKMILNDIKKIESSYRGHEQKTSLPTFIIMGDFNTPFEGTIKKKCTKVGFKHARNIAEKAIGPQETRTGFRDEELKIIDHILVKNAKVKEYIVQTFPQGKYPSDHHPICAKIILP